MKVTGVPEFHELAWRACYLPFSGFVQPYLIEEIEKEIVKVILNEKCNCSIRFI